MSEPTKLKSSPHSLANANAVFLFPTPVGTARIEGAESLIAELKDVILAKMAEDEGVKHSNEGGWHSDTNMLTWGGSAARQLAKGAIGLAKKLSVFTDGTPADYDWRVVMWANVSGAGALNHPHVHAGNLWAAVFYVDLARDPSGVDVGGEIFIEDPRFPLIAMKQANFKMLGSDGKPQGSQVPLNTHAGDLVIFPAWLRHGVRPYRGTGQRISVALNLDVTERSAAATRARRANA